MTKQRTPQRPDTNARIRKSLIEKYGGRLCQRCGKPSKKLTVDHIFPSPVLLPDGESHNSFCQLLCEMCHRQKSQFESDLYQHEMNSSLMVEILSSEWDCTEDQITSRLTTLYKERIVELLRNLEG